MPAKFLRLSLGVLFVFLNGCVAFLHPLGTEKTIVSDPSLIGMWKKGEDTIKFEAHEDGGSALLVKWTDEDKLRVYKGRVVSIDGTRFLEGMRDSSDKDLGIGFYPVFTICRIAKTDAVLSIACVNDSYMNKQLREGKIRLRHERRDKDDYLITAKTAELEAFFRANKRNAELFESADEYRRVAEN